MRHPVNTVGYFDGSPAISRHYPNPVQNIAFDLDALMRPATISETLGEIVRQIGCKSVIKTLDYLSLQDKTGYFTTVEASKFSNWITKGNLDRRSAEKLESAFNMIIMTEKKWLTRHYLNEDCTYSLKARKNKQKPTQQ
jgi:hypothetical protein